MRFQLNPSYKRPSNGSAGRVSGLSTFSTHVPGPEDGIQFRTRATLRPDNLVDVHKDYILPGGKIKTVTTTIQTFKKGEFFPVRVTLGS